MRRGKRVECRPMRIVRRKKNTFLGPRMLFLSQKVTGTVEMIMFSGLATVEIILWPGK
jgi:hypothetical protein